MSESCCNHCKLSITFSGLTHGSKWFTLLNTWAVRVGFWIIVCTVFMQRLSRFSIFGPSRASRAAKNTCPITRFVTGSFLSFWRRGITRAISTIFIGWVSKARLRAWRGSGASAGITPGQIFRIIGVNISGLARRSLIGALVSCINPFEPCSFCAVALNLDSCAMSDLINPVSRLREWVRESTRVPYFHSKSLRFSSMTWAHLSSGEEVVLRLSGSDLRVFCKFILLLYYKASKNTKFAIFLISAMIAICRALPLSRS